jgi:hypothetical protein
MTAPNLSPSLARSGVDSVREPVPSTRRPRTGLLQAVVLLGICLLGLAWLSRAAEHELPTGVIQLDETVISGNQELPKVLYILPWQQPDGLPDIEVKTEFTEIELFRRLYPPAYRRELSYFETLDGITQE